MSVAQQEPANPLAAAARSLAWLVTAIVISVGAAGIVAGASHPPGDESRPELTWRVDAALTAELAGLDAPLTALSEDVDRLAGLARDALVDTIGRRDDLVAADLAEGERLAAAIEERWTELAGRVAALPGAAHPETLGDSTRSLLVSAQDAAAAVEPLPGAWKALAASTLPPLRVARLMEDHDASTFAATQSGVGGRFEAALESLAASRRTLDEIRALTDTLPPGGDVTTLTSWLGVSAAYDEALEALYGELSKSGGERTEAVEAALKDVERAQARLPGDTSTLRLIMGELAEGGLNGAAISIEQARGALARAVAALD
jgi:hypothetical protein